MLWLVWSVLLALIIHALLSRFSMARSILLAWIVAFPMMWIALYNLQVLPLGLLVVAVPLSVLEVAVAAWIIGSTEKE